MSTDRPTDQSMSGQQLHQIRSQALQAIRDAVENMKLRQKCLELAVQACHNRPEDVVPVAKEMYEFISEPAHGIEIEPADRP